MFGIFLVEVYFRLVSEKEIVKVCDLKVVFFYKVKVFSGIWIVLGGGI